jgi:Outer membrane protein
MIRKMGLGLLLAMVLLASPLLFAAEPDPQSPVTVQTLALDNCLELAYKNSDQLQSAAKNIQIAQNSITEAYGAFWPTIGYHYQYLNEKQDSSVNLNDPSLIPTLTIMTDMMDMLEGVGYTGTVYVNQPLYTGGKLTASLKLARLKLASAVEDERKAKQQITYNVKEAFYSLWLAEKTLDVAQASCDNMERHYQKMNNFFKAGKASRYNLLQIQVQWDAQKVLLSKAKRGLASAKTNLVTLIGRDKNQDFQVAYDPSQLQLPDALKLSSQAILEQAYKQRPEMHQMELKAAMARTNEKLAKAGYLPSLSLSYNYVDYSTDDWKLADSPTRVSSLTVGLSGLLFDGFTTKAKIAEAQNNENLVKIGENNLRNQISVEADLALQGLADSLETIHIDQTGVELAKESANIVEASFTAGASTATDLNDSQVALEQTFNDYYQGIASYLIGLAKIDLIAGTDVK